MLAETTAVGIPQVIQQMLAPGVMINACGLLILGINNKYSTVLNRIRLLNEEKRRLAVKAGGREFPVEDNIRLESIARQLQNLVPRAKLVRNAVLLYTFAIAVFVITSLMIGLDFFQPAFDLKNLVLAGFLVGMLTVITGVIFAFLEVRMGYSIILYEIKAHE